MKKTFILFTLLINISFATAQQFPSYDELKTAINENSLPLINITADISKVTKEKYIPAEIENSKTHERLCRGIREIRRMGKRIQEVEQQSCGVDRRPRGRTGLYKRMVPLKTYNLG